MTKRIYKMPSDVLLDMNGKLRQNEKHREKNAEKEVFDLSDLIFHFVYFKNT